MGAEPTILNADGSPMKRRAMAGSESPYTAASRTHQDLARWWPRNWSAQGALSNDRTLLTSRIHDLARNDGWAGAGVQRLVDNVIGAGWRLVAKPNARALGIDQEEADQLAADMEAVWRDYCEDPDCLGD
ncbi:MAG: phage portal protein, partial [Dongiaceae bacterium]